MLRAVVIDNIESIRKDNIATIKTNCPTISIIGQANSVASGIHLIKQLSPDIVFLDVEMPDTPKLVVSTNLKEYKYLLAPNNFFRTHKSHLINMMYFDHFVKSHRGSTIVIKNNANLPLSVCKKGELLTLPDNT